jgi:hypothetical protein
MKRSRRIPRERWGSRNINSIRSRYLLIQFLLVELDMSKCQRISNQMVGIIDIPPIQIQIRTEHYVCAICSGHPDAVLTNEAVVLQDSIAARYPLNLRTKRISLNSRSNIRGHLITLEYNSRQRGWFVSLASYFTNYRRNHRKYWFDPNSFERLLPDSRTVSVDSIVGVVSKATVQASAAALTE